MSVGQYIYNLTNIKDGFYVDIGAYDGITGDETIFLEQLGWNGICIEGVPDVYKQLQQNRRAITYCAFVGAKDEEEREVIQLNKRFCGSGLVNNLPLDHQNFLHRVDPRAQNIIIKTEHLETILDKLNSPKHITLLKSDTEGACLEIVKSLSFTKYSFDFISLELGLRGHPNGVFDNGLMFMESIGYKLILENYNQNDIFQKI